MRRSFGSSTRRPSGLLASGAYVTYLAATVASILVSWRARGPRNVAILAGLARDDR